ncbi:uncharacterized protein [Palaemon carinicauda]|uniref:uncharacterized protein n=1 Tax=Palaemon carinicauda TaxID=392227 RepID=UPI0035B65BDC
MNIISLLRSSVLGNEGGRLTSYDNLYIEREESEYHNQGLSSTDSRVRLFNAKRTISIVFGKKKSVHKGSNGMADNNSSDDSGGFRSDSGSDSDSGGFRAEASDRPKLRGILKTRRHRRFKVDPSEGGVTKYESFVSVTSTEGKSDGAERKYGESTPKDTVPSRNITPRRDDSERTKDRTSKPSLVATKTQHPSQNPPPPAFSTSDFKVNGDIPQPSVRTSMQPPSPPPRFSSYRETLKVDYPPPPPPPPVPERGISKSALLTQILICKKIGKSLQETAVSQSVSIPRTEVTHSTITTLANHRGAPKLVELEHDLTLQGSPRHPVPTPRSPATSIKSRLSPTTSTPREPRRAGSSNIDTFVPSSPRLEMSKDLQESTRYLPDSSPLAAGPQRSPTRPQFRKSSDIANLYLYGATGYRRPEHLSSISSSPDSVLQEVETVRSMPSRYYRPPVPFARRVLTGNVQKLTKRFEKSISRGTGKVEAKDSSEEEFLPTSVRLRRLFQREFDDIGSAKTGYRYLTVGPSGEIVQRGPWPSPRLYSGPKSPKSPKVIVFVITCETICLPSFLPVQTK